MFSFFANLRNKNKTREKEGKRQS
jgi:hypothetical protein